MREDIRGGLRAVFESFLSLPTKLPRDIQQLHRLRHSDKFAISQRGYIISTESQESSTSLSQSYLQPKVNTLERDYYRYQPRNSETPSYKTSPFVNMRLLTLLTFAATALAFPSPDSLRQLSERTIASDQCKLPTLPSNCEGVEMQDVIIQLNKLTTEQSQLILDVAKSSGAQIVHNYTGFG